MRALAFLCVLTLAGCGWMDSMFATTMVGVTVGSVAVIQRSPVDAVYSLVTGRDCSVVRLDEGKSYCRPVDPPPEIQPFCTRSLAGVDCWQDPTTVPGHPRPVGDSPTPTPEQEAYRLRRWP